MAHFAQLDENNIVVNVCKVNNEDIDNLEFPDSEPIGRSFMESVTGHANWKQTSYNNNFRVRYAGVGFYYDPQRDAFIEPKEFASWVFDETLVSWVAPVPYPDDGLEYVWNEEMVNWEPIQP